MPTSNATMANNHNLSQAEKGQTKFIGLITTSVNGIRVKLVGSSKANLLIVRRKVVVYFRLIILIKGINPFRLSFHSLLNN